MRTLLLSASLLLVALLPPAAGAQTSEAARMAALQSRILELEDEIRRLTGRVEQLEFENSSLGQRIDRLVADMDIRLRTLEGSSGGNPVAAAASAERLPEASAVTPQSTTSATSAGTSAGVPVVEPAPGTQGGAVVLGTIPRDALLGLPRPSEEAVAAAASAAARSAMQGSPAERFDAALGLLRAGSLDAAEVAFSRYLEDFPDGEDAPEAAYWLGETLYVRGDHSSAAAMFARNLRNYGSDAVKAPESLLKLGMALAAMGDGQKACASFDELERRHTDMSVPLRQALSRERVSAGCS